MNASTKMVIDDPSKFGLLATQAQEDLTKAVTATVNIMAALTSKKAKVNVAESFNSRNNFTRASINFTPMSESAGVSITQIQASTGIDERASYMARQEEGGDRMPRQGSTLAIPTDNARGGAFKNRVQSGYMVRDIRNKRGRVRGKSSLSRDHERQRTSTYHSKRHPGLTSKRTQRWVAATGLSRKANLVARAYIAHKHKLFIPMGGRGDQRNIFRINNFRFVGKGRNRSVEFDKKMIYNFSRKKTRTQPKPWLMPAAETVAKDAQKIFNSQCRKLGL